MRSKQPYIQFVFVVFREAWTWAAGFTRKHIGIEVLLAVATAFATGLMNPAEIENAILVGLATLGIMLVLTFLVSAVAAPFRIWKTQEDTIAALKQHSKPGPQPTQEALDALAGLLDEGIHEILNRRVAIEDDLNALVAFEEDWNRRLFAHLDDNFPRADALSIQRLGTIQPRVFPRVRFQRHATIMNHFSRREELMREVLARGPARS